MIVTSYINILHQSVFLKQFICSICNKNTNSNNQNIMEDN